MKALFSPSPAACFFAVALLALTTLATARDFGVSTSSKGRGTKIETERGGTAYVGPRGAAVDTAGGTKAAAGARGAAYSGDNVNAAAGRRGAAYSGPNSSGVATRRVTAVEGPNNSAVAVRPAPLPAGYIRTVPAGYRNVAYKGYNCLYVGGVYYRAVIYGGETVYVVVR